MLRKLSRIRVRSVGASQDAPGDEPTLPPDVTVEVRGETGSIPVLPVPIGQPPVVPVTGAWQLPPAVHLQGGEGSVQVAVGLAQMQPDGGSAPAADWQACSLAECRFVLRHPSSWELKSHSANNISFQLSGGSWAAVDVLDQGVPGHPGDAAGMELLVTLALSELGSAGEPRVLAKGAWPFMPTGNYVMLRTRDEARDLNFRHLLVMIALDAAHAALLGYGRVGGIVTGQDRAMAAQVLATIQLRQS